jgi:chloramphenicol O-acetyltransferase type A
LPDSFAAIKSVTTMKHLQDIETWERRDNYLFMRDFQNSWYSITTEVDCTKAWKESKAHHTSFFIRYLYALMRAVNEVKEMKYRKDKDGRVCWFDRIDATVPVAVPDGTFYTVRVPYIEDYDAFYGKVKTIITSIPTDGDPYGVNKEIIEQGDMDVVNISATPKLYFTSVTYTFFKPQLGSHWPLLNVGKAVQREGRMVMPLGFYVDHSFVDGANLSEVMTLMQQYLDL